MITDAEKPYFVAALTELASLKPGPTLTDRQYLAWWNAFSASDWTIAEFKQACAHLQRSVEFMPGPFHFDQLRKAGRPQAGEAWAFVLGFVRAGHHLAHRRLPGSAGAEVAPPAVPEAIQRAVNALGGFNAIGMTSSEQMQFLERRFAEHYDALQEANDVRESVPQIAAPPSTLRIRGPKAARDAMPRLTRERR